MSQRHQQPILPGHLHVEVQPTQYQRRTFNCSACLCIGVSHLHHRQRDCHHLANYDRIRHCFHLNVSKLQCCDQANSDSVTDFSSTVTETPASGIQTITSTAPSTVVTSTLTQPCISSISSGASVIASSSTTAIAPISTLKVSLDGACGTKSNQTCLGSTFGQCCSSYGYCGTTDLYCQTTEGCQSSYGNCTTPSPVSSGALPTSTLKTSLDGSCGGANGFVCPGSKFGDCCSPYGWCGSTTTHCGAGCQLPFGTCNTTSPTDTAPLPTSTNKVSLDGTCGGTAAQTCRGSDFGNCCSQFGFCGKTDTYCATGCQAVRPPLHHYAS
ncbi:hypothetical protein EJ04DRAFT_248296 [Polyplosphaeria fusca]|uniref:Chitin-binding type-1 domain-containing protein n=1 Tax=Polyplosphaeria fusca TaxID=682080 RepID=A0A9P4QXG3_9PLEO|nr:hypothetical protein EJ04DRAFT_248296 [Polyplosphaeria fusca]